MIKRLLSTATGIIALSVSLSASTAVSFAFSTSTGDNDFDLSLRSINTEAQQSMPSYYSSMSISFGTPRPVVDRLLFHYGMSPADAYMAIRLSVLIGRPVDEVVTVYRQNHKHGWGAIAKECGIKPGSKEFHRLKEDGVVVLNRTRKERDVIVIREKEGKHSKGHGKGKRD